MYNAEEYLSDTVESVTAQDLTDWEMILMDDCSKDDSASLCRRLAAADPRIRVLCSPRNNGPSITRNIGMKEVRGQYVLFMDSDDMLEAGLFSKVKAALDEHPAQIVMFGMAEEYYDGTGKPVKHYPVTYPEKYLAEADAIRREIIYLEKSTLLGYAWNKFYSAAFIRQNQLEFETVALNEDIIFNAAAFAAASSLYILDCVGYHYSKRINQSLTGKFVPEYFALHTRRIACLFDLYRQWGMVTQEVKEILGGLYVRYIFSALQRNCDKRAGMTHRQRKEWLRELYGQELFQCLIPCAAAESKVVVFMRRLLRKRRIALTLAAARVLFLVKNKMPILFSSVKRKG